jgi:hypothetical protein
MMSDDPEYVETIRAIEREEGDELRAMSQRSRDRSRALRNACARLQQKSSDLLRESDSMASRLHGRR